MNGTSQLKLPMRNCWPNESPHQVYLCTSLLEKSVHYAQCVITAQLQQEISVITYVSITTSANRTLPYPSVVSNVCIKISQKDRGVVSFNPSPDITNFSTNSGYSSLGFGPHICIKHRGSPNNFNPQHAQPSSQRDSFSNTTCQLFHHISQSFQSTAWPHLISGQVLSSHSVVSSPTTVRHLQSMGRSIEWTLEDSMIDGLFFCATLTSRRRGHAPFVYAGAESPTPVRRWLSWTHAVLGRAIPRGLVPMSGMKVRSLVVFSNRSAFHRWSAQSVALLILSKDQLMSCCGASTNECLDLRCRAFPLNGQVSAEWSRCPASMAKCARDSAVPLRRSSVGWMPATIGRLSLGRWLMTG